MLGLLPARSVISVGVRTTCRRWVFPESPFLPSAEVPEPQAVGRGEGLRHPHAHCSHSLAPHAPPRADTALFQEEDDYDVMQDPEFLQSVLENLPGVDPNNEAIRNAMGSLASQATKDGKKDKKEEEKK